MVPAKAAGNDGSGLSSLMPASIGSAHGEESEGMNARVCHRCKQNNGRKMFFFFKKKLPELGMTNYNSYCAASEITILPCSCNVGKR